MLRSSIFPKAEQGEKYRGIRRVVLIFCACSLRGNVGRRLERCAPGFASCQLRLVLRGRRILSPSRRAPRLPVLQHHLRAVRMHLNLCGDAGHRALWALCLTQWQGVMRCGDPVRRKRDGRRALNPNLDRHRGRLTVDIRRDVGGPCPRGAFSLACEAHKK